MTKKEIEETWRSLEAAIAAFDWGIKPKCECGAERHKWPHSLWCPAYPVEKPKPKPQDGDK